MKTFIDKRKNSFRYAFSGIIYVLKTQKNSWIHLFFTLLVIMVGIFLNLSLIDWAGIFFCFGLVWVAELFNTAIETLTDLVSPDFHPDAKICKDVAAGAVLIAAICSVIIGILILGPPLYQLLIVQR